MHFIRQVMPPRPDEAASSMPPPAVLKFHRSLPNPFAPARIRRIRSHLKIQTHRVLLSLKAHQNDVPTQKITYSG